MYFMIAVGLSLTIEVKIRHKLNLITEMTSKVIMRIEHSLRETVKWIFIF